MTLMGDHEQIEEVRFRFRDAPSSDDLQTLLDIANNGTLFPMVRRVIAEGLKSNIDSDWFEFWLLCSKTIIKHSSSRHDTA